MGTRGVRTLAIALLSLLGSACSVTRHIPQGSYLLTKVSVETDHEAPRSERITSSELEKYIRQSPNKRFLGTYFYVWLYEQADTAKHNRWNNWKRKIGEAPVLLDMNLTERSVQNFKIYLDSKGFYASEASYELDTTRHPRKASITYRIRQGAPYRIDTIAYDFRDQFLRPLILADTAHSLIHAGDIFDITQLDAERTRIATYLKQRGYYNFSPSSIEYVADTLGGGHRVGVTMVIKPYLAGYNAQGEPIFENHKVYRIGRVNVYPEYDAAAVRVDSSLLERLDTTLYEGLRIVYEGRPHLRPVVLRQAIPIYPNYLYNASQVNRAYSDLIGLGYFKSARIAFTEMPRLTADSTQSYVSYIGALADSTSNRYTREEYLACHILYTPALKQSFKADVEGSTTSSFYGLKATVGYQNRNIFRGAESFDVSVTAGYEFMKAPDAPQAGDLEVPGHVRLGRNGCRRDDCPQQVLRLRRRGGARCSAGQRHGGRHPAADDRRTDPLDALLLRRGAGARADSHRRAGPGLRPGYVHPHGAQRPAGGRRSGLLVRLDTLEGPGTQQGAHGPRYAHRLGLHRRRCADGRGERHSEVLRGRLVPLGLGLVERRRVDRTGDVPRADWLLLVAHAPRPQGGVAT